jgi:hypothetical protein
LLHTFTNGADGSYPGNGLLIDADGVLYGLDDNVAFKLIPAASGGWKFEILATLGIDTNYVTAPLARDAAGKLYSTTVEGGDLFCKLGCGSVYELSPVTTEAH